MKITKILIQNFMAIGDADLRLDDRGLLLIQGVNKDDSSAKSNGSGKSSIPDALSWCLYGETARGETGDSVVNRTAGKGCMVQTMFEREDTGAVYVVSRHRKHPTHKNRLLLSMCDPTGMIADSDLTLGTDKLTQERITGLLGCSLDVFNAAIYAGQDRMPDLPSLTDKQLKELVEEAAGISILHSCSEIATKEHLTAKALLSSLETSHAKAIALQEAAESTIELLTESERAWAVAHTTHLRDYEKEVVSLKIVKEEAVRRATAARELADLAVKGKAEISKNLKERDGIEALLKTAKKELAALDRVMASAKTKAHLAAQTAKKTKAAIENINDRIGAPCGECGKPYESTDLAAALEVARRDHKAALDQYKSLKEGFDTAVLALSEKQSECDSIAATLPDVTALTKQLEKCNETVMAATAADEAVRRADDKSKAANDRYLDLTKLANPHAATLGIEKLKWNDFCEKASSLLERVNTATVDVLLRKAVSEVYSPAGVRAHILDHVTPYLNARTSHYLSALSDGNLQAIWNTLTTTAKGELREKFNIEVKSRTGGDSFGLLSGGEKRKVRLACAMALQDVVAQRALHPIRLFVADEIDDALDDAGLERLMGLLDEKAREKGTVLVISHNELSDWIREQITVTKSGGYSSIA